VWIETLEILMNLLRVRLPYRVAGVALLWGLLLAGLLAAPLNPENKDKPASLADKVRKDLDQAINFEVVDQSIAAAVNQLREQTKINFVLDRFTIQQMGIDPEQPIVNLKLKDVKVRSVLKSMLSTQNLSYAIIGDTVLISTDEVAMFRQMRQRVNVDFEKVEFASAMKHLARETATNLMLDSRVAKDAKAEVSLQMEDVPLETAVRLMAEMIGLKPVRVGNVLFVTSKASANEMRADPDFGPSMPPQPGGRAEAIFIQQMQMQAQLGAIGGGAIGIAQPVPVAVPPIQAPPPPKDEKQEKAPAEKDKPAEKEKQADKEDK
jgi:hypothetical protein